MTAAPLAARRWLTCLAAQAVGLVVLVGACGEIRSLDHTLVCLRADFGSSVTGPGFAFAGHVSLLPLVLFLSCHVLPAGVGLWRWRRRPAEDAVAPQLLAIAIELGVLGIVWMAMISTVLSAYTARNCFCE